MIPPQHISLIATDYLHIHDIHRTKRYSILIFWFVHMDQYQAVDIDHLARMYTKRTKYPAEDWWKECESRASRRLAKEAEKLRKQEDARACRENALKRQLREEEAVERYLRDVGEVEAFRIEQEARCFREGSLEQRLREEKTFNPYLRDLREAEAFRIEQETRSNAKRLAIFRKDEEARCLREDALERYFRAEQAFVLEASRVEPETSKRKETRALQQLQQDVSNARAQEVGRPLQRKKSHKPKPSPSYYWPQEAPSAWDKNPPIPFPKRPTARARAPQINIPYIVLTPPEPESEPSPHTRPKVIDTSMLSPTYTPRTPSPNLRPPSNSKARKSRLKTGGHQRLAPKPSLFSYNTCDHPQCPLRGYAHEKGVFLYPEKYATDEEYAAAAVTFGKGNPTPGIWDAYLNAMADLRASDGDTGAVRRKDIEVVKGFVAAHPMP